MLLVLSVVSPLQINHTDISPESSLRVISLSCRCNAAAQVLDFKMSPAAKEGESSVEFGGRFNKKQTREAETFYYTMFY